MKKTQNVSADTTMPTGYSQLNAAILSVMDAVKFIQNDKTIGFGQSAFKTVSGEKLKTVLQPILVQNGITIRQTNVSHSLDFREWEDGGKIKREYICVAVVTYAIEHVSGETVEGQSLGMGINQGDKSPGIALSFALRNFLLNTFVIPHGEDSDNVGEPEEPQAPAKPTITPDSDLWGKAIAALKAGKTTIEVVAEKYNIAPLDLVNLKSAAESNA
jgi:hypothetical protein